MTCVLLTLFLIFILLVLQGIAWLQASVTDESPGYGCIGGVAFGMAIIILLVIARLAP